MIPTLMKVVARAQDTRDTFSLEFEPEGGFRFEPGQFNMLFVPGYGEVPISVSGDPEDEARLVHTIRAVGATTRALSRVKPGDVVGVRGPFGVPWPEVKEKAGQLVVVAGGIGLAPLRSTILRTLRQCQELFLVYGGRSPEQLLYTRQLSEWASKKGVSCRVTVDRGTDQWDGCTGTVTKHIAALGFEPNRAIACVCGPEVMIRFAARSLQAAGMAAERIFVSLERNMQCGVGHCGRCQLGPHLLCQSGPVLPWSEAASLMAVSEL